MLSNRLIRQEILKVINERLDYKTGKRSRVSQRMYMVKQEGEDPSFIHELVTSVRGNNLCATFLFD